MKIKIVLISVSILLVLSLIVGFSYAAWILTVSQGDNNLVSTGCFDIDFTEDTDAIALANSFPMIDADGMNLVPFTFTVNNICDIDAGYQVNLEVLSTTTLDHSLIKGVLDNNVPEVMTDKDVVVETIEGATSYKFDVYPLAAGASRTHDFRMWLDEAATLDNSQGKTLKTKIVIIAAPNTQLIPKYEEEHIAGANPTFTGAMIPVSDGLIADLNTEWYDYETGRLANVMLTTAANVENYDNLIGDDKDSIDNLGEYVWIPRFKYNKNEIIFESSNTPKSTGDGVDSFLTHPAFTKDGNELSGIWVSKYFLSNDSLIVGLDESSLLYSVSDANASMYSLSSDSNYVSFEEYNNYISELNDRNAYGLGSAYDIHGMSSLEEKAMKIFAEYYNTNANSHYKYVQFPYDTGSQLDGNVSGIHNIIENHYNDVTAYFDSNETNNEFEYVNNIPLVSDLFIKTNNRLENDFKVVPILDNNLPPAIIDVIYLDGGKYNQPEDYFNVGLSTDPLQFMLLLDYSTGDTYSCSVDKNSSTYSNISYDTNTCVYTISPKLEGSGLYFKDVLDDDYVLEVVSSSGEATTLPITIYFVPLGPELPSIDSVSINSTSIGLDSNNVLKIDGSINYKEVTSNGYDHTQWISKSYSAATDCGKYGVCSVNSDNGSFNYLIQMKDISLDLAYSSTGSLSEQLKFYVSDSYTDSAVFTHNININNFGFRGHRTVITVN